MEPLRLEHFLDVIIERNTTSRKAKSYKEPKIASLVDMALDVVCRSHDLVIYVDLPILLRREIALHSLWIMLDNVARRYVDVKERTFLDLFSKVYCDIILKRKTISFVQAYDIIYHLNCSQVAQPIVQKMFNFIEVNRRFYSEICDYNALVAVHLPLYRKRNKISS